MWWSVLDKSVKASKAIGARQEFFVHTRNKKIKSRALGILNYYRENEPYTFGQALCACMEKTKTTVAILADKTGISERQITRMRRDEAKEISFRVIIAVSVAMKLTQGTVEKLLNTKRYTLQCDDPYVQICKLFFEEDVSVEECNELLKSIQLEPLTDGQIWAL